MKSAYLSLAAVLLAASSVAGAPVPLAAESREEGSTQLHRRLGWKLTGFESTMIAAGLTGFISAPIAISASVIGSQATNISKGVIDKQVANKAVTESRAREAAAAEAAKQAAAAKQSEAQKMKLWLELLRILRGHQNLPAKGAAKPQEQGQGQQKGLSTQDITKIAMSMNAGGSKAAR